MIAVSLLLVAGAVTLLVLGLWLSSSAMLGGSIAASLVAAVLLVIGARRSASNPWAAAHRESARRPSHREHGDRPSYRDQSGRPWQRERGAAAPAGPPGGGTDATRTDPPRRVGRLEPAVPPSRPFEPVNEDVPASPGPLRNGSTQVTEPIVREPPGSGAGRGGPDDYLDPPDEPAPQQVSAADAERVGRMATEVLVVDGRPRYHLPGCVHLLGRESEPLPVREAIELGFSPCGLCEPDSALLADRRV